MYIFLVDYVEHDYDHRDDGNTGSNIELGIMEYLN